MRFMERLSLLVKADAHGVLEQLEERTLLAKQHLREAELELDRKRARLEAIGEEARRLADDAERLEREAASLDTDVELAISQGEEELARFSVRRLLPIRGAAEAVRRRLAELELLRARLAEKLSTQERQLEELRAQVGTRIAVARAEEREAFAGPASVAEEEIELELMRRRAAHAEGR